MKLKLNVLLGISVLLYGNFTIIPLWVKCAWSAFDSFSAMWYEIWNFDDYREQKKVFQGLENGRQRVKIDFLTRNYPKPFHSTLQQDTSSKFQLFTFKTTQKLLKNQTFICEFTSHVHLKSCNCTLFVVRSSSLLESQQFKSRFFTYFIQ